MTERTDVAVIGAGPAGLSAAAAAAGAGSSVTLLDDQPEAGGQIYRAVGRAGEARARILGADYGAGKALLGVLEMPRLRHLTEATVWNVTPEREIYFSRPQAGGNEAAVLRAGQLIVCTGATERPMPFPGWTLPGVMTAGAGQILLKASGVLPRGPTVLAGSGPLLLLLAAQYLRAGHALAAIVETTPPANRWRALGHLPGALRGNAVLRKGLALLAEIKRHRVDHYRGARGLHAQGGARAHDRVESLRFEAGGKQREIPCSSLLIHNGVVPNVQISRGLGLSHDWDAQQRCWRPSLGPWGESEHEGIAIAGDGGGIAGAEAAVERGRIAGLHAAWRLGALTRAEAERQAAPARRRLARQAAVRPFLDALYAPAAELLAPADETIVCRCEEVTAAAIRGYVKLGCLGPNQAKSFGRPGMGPCQGRFCGLSVSEVIAAERGVSPEEVGYYRIRPPFKPVTLSEIAAIALPGDASSEDRNDESVPAA